MEEKVTETQVLIIGGGIIGTAIARELSRYKVDVCLVEKEAAVGFGITKGSLGLLHSGIGICTSRLVKWWDRSVDVNIYLRQPLRTKERLNIIGRKMLIELEPFLNTKVLKCGRIILAQNEDDIKVLQIIKEVAEGIGVKDLVSLDKNKLQEMEPALDYSKFIGGLYDPGEYSVFPAEWPIAFAENADENGAHILLSTEVRGIEERKGYYLIETSHGSIRAEFVINAAGLFSDRIAAMVDKIDWSFVLWKTHLMIIENKGYLNHVVSEVIVPQNPRIMVPTTEGNIEVGAPMEKGTDKYDYSTTKEMLDVMADCPQFYVPSVSLKRDMIRSFIGYMHFNTRDPDDYIIEWP
ncbi:FAD-dependent oxidoreductase, partial [bacterium]|nr:FAD-dependent oxidoreductase [bacterium]